MPTERQRSARLTQNVNIETEAKPRLNYPLTKGCPQLAEIVRVITYGWIKTPSQESTVLTAAELHATKLAARESN